MNYKYCHRCGKATQKIKQGGRERDYCPHCDTIFYLNPIPSVAICATDQQGRLLLVKRAVAPEKGKWCLPGGFMENGETSKATALRELHEETGLTGHSPLLLGVETHLNGFFGDILLIGYSVELETYNPTAGDDASAAQFFASDTRPAIAFRAHRKFIQKFQQTNKL